MMKRKRRTDVSYRCHVTSVVVVVVVVADTGCVRRSAAGSEVLSACFVSDCSPNTVHYTRSTVECVRSATEWFSAVLPGCGS